MPTMLMTRTRNGNASATSITLMIRVSNQPPNHPAMSPRAVPATKAMPTITKAMIRFILAAYTVRLNTSRPNWSVPNRWLALIDSRASEELCCRGSWVATTGASTATAMMTASSANPAARDRSEGRTIPEIVKRRRWARASDVCDAGRVRARGIRSRLPGVEGQAGEVDEQCDDYH